MKKLCFGENSSRDNRSGRKFVVTKVQLLGFPLYSRYCFKHFAYIILFPLKFWVVDITSAFVLLSRNLHTV